MANLWLVSALDIRFCSVADMWLFSEQSSPIFFDRPCRSPPNYTNGTHWILNGNVLLFGTSSLSNEKKNIGLYQPSVQRLMCG